ncbi:Histone-lysine N-methyltransferase PRDM9 [Araneus ventricosus]|uniref:Histone-lysine N-methyltransferase PRDM9 n=1 Tax=Araneus ventricosus TaxID=182803 RepID=A0A4Y2K8L3_ARAVE|nr:Histone-lysine N-methyltransferase PRDM9 [Araneus ventricosus]
MSEGSFVLGIAIISEARVCGSLQFPPRSNDNHTHLSKISETLANTVVPKGDPERAKRTLPYFFSVGISSIPKAGVGVWTEVPLVAGMVFGPFEGKILKKNHAYKAGEYSWEVRKQSKVHHCVDAADKSISNWMRYVNCADDEQWQTMTAFQYMGKIYYKTYKPVLPYTEILIWYGDDYASKLGIEVKAKKFLQPPKEITGFPCDVCSSLFSSPESLRSHRKKHARMQHDGRHRCPECSYSSDKATHLRRHLLTHSGEKPHACPHCPKRFSRVDHLRTHLLLHTGQKQHACTTCGERFSLKHYLVQHERTHSGERPYRCPDCGKDFTRASHLNGHRRLHTRQRPYPCPHCEYRSTESGTLTRHISRKHAR